MSVCSKSHAFRVVRFGEDEYSRMMLEVQASLIGLEDGQQVLSAEDRSHVEALHNIDGTSTAEFQQAKGRHMEHYLNG